MKIEIRNNEITIINLRNNYNFNLFEKMYENMRKEEIEFEVLNYKKLIIKLDNNNGNLFNALDCENLDDIKEENVKNLLDFFLTGSDIKEKSFFKEYYLSFLENDDLLKDKSYIQLDNYYLELNDFIYEAKNLDKNLFFLLNNKVITFYLETEKYVKIIEQWEDNNEIWDDNIHTYIEKKECLKKIKTFKEIVQEKE